jgi:hypothetical protein
MQTNEIIAKLSLKKFVLIKKRNVNFSYAATLSLKTSKSMKLLKNYSLNKSKNDEIISFTFPIIDNRNRKTTPRLGGSPTRQVSESANKTILGYSCGLQSSLYAKNHRFTFKALIFCPKTSIEFY